MGASAWTDDPLSPRLRLHLHLHLQDCAKLIDIMKFSR
jgi:hypothetical protein